MSKAHYFKGALAGGAVVVLGGFLAPAALAAPGGAGPFAATLSQSGTGSSAAWDSPNAVKLTVGTGTGAYASVSITNPPAQAPVTEPSFTTDNYSGGSPKWVITFSNGCQVFVYPTGTGQFSPAADNAAVNENTGTCTPATGLTWAQALQGAGSSTATVSGAAIVAGTPQTPSTTDTITDISYDGRGVAPASGGSQPQPNPTHTRPGGPGQPQPGHGYSQPSTQVGTISSFTDYSNSCLTAGDDTAGSGLVLDKCGMDRSGGQDFGFSSAGHHTVLEAFTRGGRGRGGQNQGGSLCVTAPHGQGQLTLQPCTGSSGQDVVKNGSYYVFEDDHGYVMDDAKWDTASGSPVIAFPFNGGRNQRWSSPGA